MREVWDGSIGNTPAAVNRLTGVLYLHPVLFKRLSPFHQKFVKLHEEGHYKLNTGSEFEADAYAFDRLAGTEFRSLKQCLSAISDVLDPSNPAKRPRYNALLKRALQWDFQHGNARAGEALKFFEDDRVTDRFTLINTENTGDAVTKAMQSLIGVLQQTEAERINESASRKSQQNFLVMVAVAFAVYYFVFKD